MKKKPVTYVLILGVVAVWAIIIKKVVNVSNDENPKVAVVSLGNGKTEQKWYMKDYDLDSADVNRIDKDPFKPNQVEPEKIMSESIEERKVIATPAFKPQIIWPQVNFKGFASKRNQKAGRYAILSINSQPFMLAEGETAMGVKLQKNWGDSLALSYQKENKKFYLQTQ